MIEDGNHAMAKVLAVPETFPATLPRKPPEELTGAVWEICMFSFMPCGAGAVAHAVPPPTQVTSKVPSVTLTEPDCGTRTVAGTGR